MEGLNTTPEELALAREFLTKKYSTELNIPIEQAELNFDNFISSPIKDYNSNFSSFSEDLKKAITGDSSEAVVEEPIKAVVEDTSGAVVEDTSSSLVESTELVITDNKTTEKKEPTSTELVIADNKTTEKKEPTSTELVVSEEPQPKQASTDLVVAKKQEKKEEKKQIEESDVESKIQELFNAVDKNDNKKIQRTEFILAIRKKKKNVSEIFGLPNKIKQEDGTRDEFEKIFQAIDSDGDGEITFEELKKYILDKKNKVKMEKMTAGRRKTRRKRKSRRKSRKKRKTRRRKN